MHRIIKSPPLNSTDTEELVYQALLKKEPSVAKIFFSSILPCISPGFQKRDEYLSYAHGGLIHLHRYYGEKDFIQKNRQAIMDVMEKAGMIFAKEEGLFNTAQLWYLFPPPDNEHLLSVSQFRHQLSLAISHTEEPGQTDEEAIGKSMGKRIEILKKIISEIKF